MADARRATDEPAHGFLRAGRAARRGGDDDARPLPVAVVRVFHAEDCSLCAPALEVVEGLRVELGFDLDLVDIGGDAELEARYRERIPLVEIDGVPAFTHFVDRDALRERLGG